MKKFIFCLLSLVLSLSFFSCSEEETNIYTNINGCCGSGSNVTEEVVKIILNNGNIQSATRADEATAVGLYPDVTDVKFLFFASGTVVAESNIIALTSTTTQDVSLTIPSNTDAVMAICNTSLVPSYFVNTTLGKTLTTVNSWLFELSKQTHPITGVAVTGYTTTVGSTMTIDLYPVVTRIEIGKVEVDMSGKLSPIQGIALEAIYINNYNKYVGLDKTSISTNAVNQVFYTTADLNSSGRLPSLYGLPRYEHIYSAGYFLAGTASFAPTNGVWGNQVLPVANNVPQVIFQFRFTTYPNDGLDRVGFVTVSGYKDGGGVAVTTLNNGVVYSFDLSCTYADITNAPNVTTIASTATLTKKAWSGVIVNPEY